MNSKIKKAMEAILKSYFEGEVIFEESEIAEVIDAATNDGAVEMMDRSMDYVYRTVVKVNDVFVTQIGFRELSTLGLYEVNSDLETMRFSFNPYNINSLTLRAASAAIKDKAYYDDCIDKIIENREETKIALKEMGFKVLDSKSNFIFASHSDLSAKNLYEELKNRGILVRYFGKERIKDFVRITVGSKEQMQKVTEEIKNILKG